MIIMMSIAGGALKAASVSGHVALSEKAAAIAELLRRHGGEVNCTWARHGKQLSE